MFHYSVEPVSDGEELDDLPPGVVAFFEMLGDIDQVRAFIKATQDGMDESVAGITFLAEAEAALNAFLVRGKLTDK